MISCYNDYTYSYVTMIFGMALFAPIAIICVIGAVAKAVAFLMKLKEILKWKQ